MSKKDKNINQEKNQDLNKSEVNNQKDSDKSEIIKLQKTIEELTNQNKNLLNKCNSYELQIKAINDEYVKKMTEKAKQANELIEKKTNEIKTILTKEFETKTKFSLEKILVDIINVINQFEIALSHEPTDPKILNYQKGFNMFLTMLKTLLTNADVKEVSVNINQEFDPTKMECFELQNSNEINNNCVIKVIKKGYQLHDRVIAPALVIVCKKAN